MQLRFEITLAVLSDRREPGIHGLQPLGETLPVDAGVRQHDEKVDAADAGADHLADRKALAHLLDARHLSRTRGEPSPQYGRERDPVHEPILVRDRQRSLHVLDRGGILAAEGVNPRRHAARLHSAERVIHRCRPIERGADVP